jgi:hypothetical protein
MTEKYTLQYPIELPDGEKINEVSIIERLKGKHMKVVMNAEGAGNQSIAMIAVMTGLDEDIVGEMDQVDIAEISQRLEKKAQN